jgi:hypothetical protein
MFYLKKISYSLIILIFVSISNDLSASLNEEEIQVKVHNIGQGNCVTLRAFDEKQKRPLYMLIDAGTSSFRREMIYNELQSPIKPGSINLDIPPSVIKEPNFHSTLDEVEEEPAGINEIEFINDMRKMFGEGDSDQPIHIKTVVITHPDADHYNWLPRIFNHPKDKIDYLILGGLPECYDPSGKLNLHKWIQARLKNKSKVFFPAIKYEAIITLEEVRPSEKRTFAPHDYTSIEGTLEAFKEAVSFGKNVKISFLSINPTHMRGNHEEILRLSDSEDDNRDSLVLKIDHGISSIILTGDATNVTTTRIINNYADRPNFLHSNVLLASHHGSATHGSNNFSWLSKVLPEYVLISNGHNQGHPQSQAYDSFKKLSSLKNVTPHKVLVGKSEDYDQGSLHETSKAIFSTLNSGTITVTLSRIEGVSLLTKKEGKISIISQIKEITEPCVTGDKEETVLCTPVKQKKKRINLEEIRPLPLYFEDESKISLKEESSSVEEPFPLATKKKEKSNKKRKSSSTEAKMKPSLLNRNKKLKHANTAEKGNLEIEFISSDKKLKNKKSINSKKTSVRHIIEASLKKEKAKKTTNKKSKLPSIKSKKVTLRNSTKKLIQKVNS